MTVLFVLASIQKFFFLPLEMVLLGVGKAIKQVEPASVGAQVWDEGVRVFEVRRHDRPIGYYFLDP